MFESIYLCFKDWYGEPLRNFLSGFDCLTEAYTGPVVYTQVGIATLVFVVLTNVVYYKLWDPTGNKRIWWLCSLLLTSLLSAVGAYYWVGRAESLGHIGECLLRDDAGNLRIDGWDYLGFAASNALIALIIFFVISIGVKFLSTNNRYIPF